MASIMSIIVAGLLGVVTTAVGWGWINDGGFSWKGAALNLVLIFIETAIFHAAFDEKK